MVDKGHRHYRRLRLLARLSIKHPEKTGRDLLRMAGYSESTAVHSPHTVFRRASYKAFVADERRRYRTRLRDLLSAEQIADEQVYIATNRVPGTENARLKALGSILEALDITEPKEQRVVVQVLQVVTSRLDPLMIRLLKYVPERDKAEVGRLLAEVTGAGRTPQPVVPGDLSDDPKVVSACNHEVELVV